MALNQIKFTKTLGGLGRVAPSEDHISGLIFAGMDSGTDIFALSSPEDLNSYLSPGNPEKYSSYISSEKRNPGEAPTIDHVIYYHVQQFFSMNPTGRLYFQMLSSQITSSDIIDFQKSCDGKVRQLGVFDESLDFTGDGSGAETIIGELESAASTLEEVEFAPLSIIAQGFGDLASFDSSDLSGKNAKNVSITIAQSGSGEGYAMISTLMNLFDAEQYVITNLADINTTFTTGTDQEITEMISDLSDVGASVSKDKLKIKFKNKVLTERADTGSSFPAFTESISAQVRDGFVIGSVGTVLGAVSKSSVHENIGWVQKFNLGAEFNVPTFVDRTPVSEVNKASLDILDENRFIFMVKHIGDVGTYFNDSHVADKATSDFAYIESNRTINKAIRDVRASLLPQLNSPLAVDATTGGLAIDTIKFFENLAGSPLSRMLRAGELSGFAVGINPDQDVLATSRLDIVLKLVPVGVAREIQVKIGFAAKVSS
ncbi:DUF2586 family protein [Aureibacter tunicatorum]|uniref:DUF2586 family protein n=1 Tax=Aureibacter tunicatorum TaxID=866807 RepID=A0AAE3XUF1_9BACT|nr:DUF2586 family protein [Aureibacter tunicatorum]MDR6241894.1 hypothetical protein [Aureibacter tunicatorum]BDD07443.1 hypothetical protein AUTU_49260 [Aureibacter tunicatorum]